MRCVNALALVSNLTVWGACALPGGPFSCKPVPTPFDFGRAKLHAERPGLVKNSLHNYSDIHLHK